MLTATIQCGTAVERKTWGCVKALYSIAGTPVSN